MATIVALLLVIGVAWLAGTVLIKAADLLDRGEDRAGNAVGK